MNPNPDLRPYVAHSGPPHGDKPFKFIMFIAFFALLAAALWINAEMRAKDGVKLNKVEPSFSSP